MRYLFLIFTFCATASAHALAGSAVSPVGLLETVNPTVNGVTAEPPVAGPGDPVEISFSVSEAMGADPVVLVNGHAATLAPSSGLFYVYAYTIAEDDPIGTAFISISGADLVGNGVSMVNTNALDVTFNSVNLPVSAWPLIVLLPLAGIAALRRRNAVALAACAVLFGGTALAAEPVVSNVSFVQQPGGSGTVVDISFDLVTLGLPCDITVALSKDGGTDGYIHPVNNISGNIAGLNNGTGYHILWDIAADYPGQQIPQARLRVTADDSAQVPVLTGFSIENGASTTLDFEVTLGLTYTNAPTQYMVSTLSDFSDATWQAVSPTVNYSIPAPTGMKTVYAKVRNVAGESNVLSDNIMAFSIVPPELLPVPASTFTMGDVFGEGDADELPVHTVSVSAYEIGKYEITNAQYASVLNWAKALGYLQSASATSVTAYGRQMIFISDGNCQVGFDGSDFYAKERDSIAQDNHPLVSVGFYGTLAYCNWLSEIQGLEPCYNTTTWVCDFSKNGYRLPTEAEWECAASHDPAAPTSSRWRTGYKSDTYDTTRHNSFNINPIGFSTDPKTTPVGYYDGSSPSRQLGASPIGAFDMSGNVSEWLNDAFSATYYSTSPATDPTGASGTSHVVRGGAYLHGDFGTRSSDRVSYVDFGGDFFLGFRIAR